MVCGEQNNSREAIKSNMKDYSNTSTQDTKSTRQNLKSFWRKENKKQLQCQMLFHTAYIFSIN